MTTFEQGATVVAKRRRLPHYYTDGGLYFVTWRLADAIPRDCLATLLSIRNGTTPREREYRAKVEKLLDAGHGTSVLRNPRAAVIVRDALAFFDGDRYSLIAWVVMPNHVHVLFRLLNAHRLDAVVHSIKSFTASAINRKLCRSGSLWQSEYFDVSIRSPRHLQTATNYILANPEKAGLADYAFVGVDHENYAALL